MPDPQRPSLIQTVLSVLQAAIGIQSSKNRERDFSSGSLPVFIMIAVIATLLFILAIFGVVTMVTQNPG